MRSYTLSFSATEQIFYSRESTPKMCTFGKFPHSKTTVICRKTGCNSGNTKSFALLKGPKRNSSNIPCWQLPAPSTHVTVAVTYTKIEPAPRNFPTAREKPKKRRQRHCTELADECDGSCTKRLADRMAKHKQKLENL